MEAESLLFKEIVLQQQWFCFRAELFVPLEAKSTSTFARAFSALAIDIASENPVYNLESNHSIWEAKIYGRIHHFVLVHSWEDRILAESIHQIRTCQSMGVPLYYSLDFIGGTSHFSARRTSELIIS